MTYDAAATPRRNIRWWWIAVYGALLGGLIGLNVWVGLRWHDDRNTAAAEHAAQRVIPKYAVEISTYDYRHLDQDIAQVAKVSTGKFGDKYRKLTNELRGTFLKYQATTSATVPNCAGIPCVAIHSMSGDHIVAVVAVDQVARNKTIKAPRTDSYRMELSLFHRGGRWLIDDVRLL